MSTPLHDKQTYAEGIHTIVAYVYADQATREAATGFETADLHKVAFQTDNESYWTLTSITPTWTQLNGTGGPGGSGGGDSGPTYLVLSSTGSLTRERVFSVSGSSGLLATDNGANSTFGLSINNNVVATLSGSRFTGPVSASAGLSGSLQQIAPNLPYLLSQGNITIITQSNGQIIISASFVGTPGPAGPTGSSGQFIDGGNQLKTTSSVAISGPDNVYASAKGTDVFFFVSGTLGLSSSVAQKALFGGDTHHSGSIKVEKSVVFASEINLGNKGSASPVIDFRLGQKFRMTLTGSFTASFIDPPGANSLTLLVIQDSVGSRTIRWPASVKWPSSGTIPTLSTQPNAVDIISFYHNGSSSYYGVASLLFL